MRTSVVATLMLAVALGLGVPPVTAAEDKAFDVAALPLSKAPLGAFRAR
ncbi:hypothetical protein [Pseudomonas sp. P97.38]|nr:hypothetical protein [Pseudomonas sp. P97.38]